MNRERKLVLLGDPGSGKSAFVNFVALCHARALLDDPQLNLAALTAPLPAEAEEGQRKQEAQPTPQPWDHGPLLPVRIVLRDWAASHLPAVGEAATARHLWNFLEAELEKAKLGDFAEPLRKHLLEKGGLVLLDGLDEAPEADQRRVQIKEAVEDFAASFPNCRLLVTSRTYAYQQPAWQLQGFAVSLLAAFSNGQIRHFVDRWYAHRARLLAEDGDKAQARADELKGAIFANPRLHELAVRPLLLALTASLHAWRNGKLPNNREELYADAVDLLLEQWETQRMDPRKRTVQQTSLAAFLEVGREKMLVLLQRLAHQAHANQQQLSGAADIAESDLVAGLLELSDKADLQPRQLINYLSQRAGLLYERGSKVYTFAHRTFQEYLAACHLTGRTRFPSEMADLLRSDPNRWREVTLLAAAKAKRGAIYTFWALVDRLCRGVTRGEGDRELGAEEAWGVLLAGQAIDEGISLAMVEEEEAERVARVRWALVQVVEGRTLPAVERALAGRTLAHLGDPRPAVMTVEQMEFCAIPAGPFAAGKAEKKARKNGQAGELPYPYWMSRYPVTHAQYSLFVGAQGYSKEGYWPEAQKEGYWSKEGFKGRYDGVVRTAPYAYRGPFSLANHPVVGVTWYEAVAFCRWFSEQMTIPSWRVRLPSEAEWAKAAVGGLETPATPLRVAWAEQGWGQAMPALTPNGQPQRRYPWGDEFSPELANGQESNIGATSAVGCFSGGASPYGVEELSGNVWEWLWREPGDLAGGAFWNNAQTVGSAARLWLDPNRRYVYNGFRCVVVPISR